MTLPIDSDDYRFYKTLNEDVSVKPVSSTSDHWDIQMDNGDYVNVSGKESLWNAICIAIMTRYKELSTPLYDDFGCRVHELVKANKSNMVKFEVELFITDALEKMRRVQEVNDITVIEKDNGYHVDINVTSIDDNIVSGSVVL